MHFIMLILQSKSIWLKSALNTETAIETCMSYLFMAVLSFFLSLGIFSVLAFYFYHTCRKMYACFQQFPLLKFELLNYIIILIIEVIG